MTTHVARGHGGDGGDGGDREDPNIISTNCQTSQQKRTRSKAKNLKLLEKFMKNGENPLPIEFDSSGSQYKFVGENGSLIRRCMSYEIARLAPRYHPRWEAVPHGVKVNIFNTLEYYFELRSFKDTEHWAGVLRGIERDCADSYGELKHEMKQHFDKYGGYENVSEAKKHPPEELTQEHWEKIIDLFQTDEYKARSEQNKKNRANLPYTSSHGSRSYAQMRHLQAKETGKSSPIDVWYKAHHKEGRSEFGGFENATTQGHWHDIQHGKAQAVETCGDSSVNELGVISKALGERRGHIRGYGRKCAKTSPDMTSGSMLACSSSSYTDMQQRIEQQDQVIKEQQQTIERMHKCQEDMREDMRKGQEEMTRMMQTILSQMNNQSGSSKRRNKQSGPSRRRKQRQEEESDGGD